MAVKKAEVVEIRPINMNTINLKIVGDTPLIVHAWSFKALMELYKFDSGLKKKLPRNPVAEVASALYWMDAEKNPFPRLPFTMMSNGKDEYPVPVVVNNFFRLLSELKNKIWPWLAPIVCCASAPAYIPL